MKQEKTAKPSTYESNPFVLAHQAAKRLYNTNKRWAIVLIVLGVLNTVTSGDTSNPDFGSGITGASNPEVSVALVVFVASLIALFMIGVLIVATYMTGILSYITLQSENGKKASFSDAFQATTARFWRLLSSILLAFVKVVGWTFVFIIPGIVAAVRYTLLGYVIMDEPTEKTSAKESHERIKQLTAGRLWEVFGISSTSIVPFIGTLYSSTGSAGLYLQLKNYTDKKLEKPKIHWLNYGLLMVMLIFVGALTALAWSSTK